MSIENDGDQNENLKATKRLDLKANECIYQTFALKVDSVEHFYCFNKKTYHLAFIDEFATENGLHFQKENINKIFQDSDINIDEDVELIFSYKNDTTVFMTLNHLHILKNDLFTLAEDLINLKKEYQNKSLPPEIYTKLDNCFFNQSNCDSKVKKTD